MRKLTKKKQLERLIKSDEKMDKIIKKFIEDTEKILPKVPDSEFKNATQECVESLKKDLKNKSKGGQ